MLAPSDGSGTAQPIATDFIDQVLFSPDGKLMSYDHLDTSQKQVGLQRAVVTFLDGKAVVSGPGTHWLPVHGRWQRADVRPTTVRRRARNHLQGAFAGRRATKTRGDSRFTSGRRPLGGRENRDHRGVLAEEPGFQSLALDSGFTQGCAADEFSLGVDLRVRRLARWENDLLHARLEQPRHHQDYRSG